MKENTMSENIWFKIRFNSGWDAMTFNANIGFHLPENCTIHNEPDKKLPDNVIKYIVTSREGLKACRLCARNLGLTNVRITNLTD